MTGQSESQRATCGRTALGAAAHPLPLPYSLPKNYVGGLSVAQLDRSVPLSRLHPAMSLPGEQQ
jgi:hypothetical protein